MKPIASISLDLDNQWSYMKTHGDTGWKEFPSYLDVAVPRILSFLKERNLTITFFIVGQDAALEKNHAAIRSIADAGHEIANHSFNHEPWLHLYSREELIEEFEKTENALENVTGVRPIGFRGPGFSLSPTVLDVLGERGYEYDGSTLPTYIAPLARAFFFLKSPAMSPEEKEKLKKLFGKFSDGFRPLTPHLVDAGSSKIVEIPVTTFPIVKVPVHVSYLMYLKSFSSFLANAYWKAAMLACRITGTQPSLLLHPLDFLSGDEIEELKFFPGMAVPSAKKVAFLDQITGLLCKHYEVVTMRQHAETASLGLHRTSQDLALKRA